MTEQVANEVIEAVQDEIVDPIQFDIVPELATEIRDVVLRFEEQGVNPLNLAVTVLWMGEALKRDFPWMADIVFTSNAPQEQPVVEDGN